jgi:hypothetical protein
MVLRLWLIEFRPWRLNCQLRQLTQMLQQLTHMLTVIHSLKIQGLTMMSTLSFLILLHTNVEPSPDKVWEVIKIITTNTMFATMILFAKVKFSVPPFNGSYDAEAYLDFEMTVEQKFSSHLVPEQHRVRQATSEFKDFALIWWNELLLSGGMNWLPLNYNHIHGMG